MGLVAADIRGNIIRRINTDNGLSFNKTRALIEDSEKVLWCGTRSGLNRINPDTLSVETVYTTENGLSNDYILSLFEGSNGNIYAGTDGGGLNIIDRETGKIEVISSESGKIAGDIIFRISEDSDGNIWICTNKGVTLWSEGCICHITENTGLVSNAVFFTVIDDNDFIWFALNNALMKINRKILINHLKYKSPMESLDIDRNSIDFDILDTTDGLLSGITPNSWYSAGHSNEIWFPTSRGISVYYPDKSSMNTIKSNAVVEEIKLDDIAPEIFPEIIQASVKRIDIDYTGFSYVVPEKTRFRYFLEGFDNRWSNETIKRQTSYTNLPAGKYNFFLKVSNNDGYWSDPILAYSFRKRDYFTTVPIFTWFCLLFFLFQSQLYFLFSNAFR